LYQKLVILTEYTITYWFVVWELSIYVNINLCNDLSATILDNGYEIHR